MHIKIVFKLVPEEEKRGDIEIMYIAFDSMLTTHSNGHKPYSYTEDPHNKIFV